MAQFPRRALTRQRLVPRGPGTLNPDATGLPIPRGVPRVDASESQPHGGNPDRRIILPGCNFPPADAIPIDTIKELSVAEGITSEIIRIVVPDTYTMRINGIGFGAGDESGLTFLTWSILADPPGTPIIPYNNMPAAVGSIAQPSDVFVVLGSSVTATLVITNGSGVPATYQYQARLKGYFYREVLT